MVDAYLASDSAMNINFYLFIYELKFFDLFI